MKARLGRFQGRRSRRGGSTLTRARQGPSGPPGASFEADGATVSYGSVPMKHTSCIWHHVKRRAVCSFVEKFNVKPASHKVAGIGEVSPTWSLHVVCRSAGWPASA
jgi:hypothetical protein